MYVYEIVLLCIYLNVCMYVYACACLRACVAMLCEQLRSNQFECQNYFLQVKECAAQHCRCGLQLSSAMLCLHSALFYDLMHAVSVQMLYRI